MSLFKLTALIWTFLIENMDDVSSRIELTFREGATVV